MALASKLSRAITAYLRTIDACGDDSSIQPMYSIATRSYPNTTAQIVNGQPDPPLTNDNRCTVWIRIKGSAADASDETPRVAFDARVTATREALMQSDDQQSLRATAALINTAGRALKNVAGDTANQDMADFTLLEWHDGGFADGDGPANDEGCSWEHVLIFSALACELNVD